MANFGEMRFENGVRTYYEGGSAVYSDTLNEKGQVTARKYAHESRTETKDGVTYIYDDHNNLLSSQKFAKDGQDKILTSDSRCVYGSDDMLIGYEDYHFEVGKTPEENKEYVTSLDNERQDVTWAKNWAAQKADEKAAKEKAEKEAKAAKEQAEKEAKAAKEQAEKEAKAAKEQAEKEAKAAKEQADEEARKAKEEKEAAKRKEQRISNLKNDYYIGTGFKKYSMEDATVQDIRNGDRTTTQLFTKDGKLASEVNFRYNPGLRTTECLGHKEYGENPKKEGETICKNYDASDNLKSTQYIKDNMVYREDFKDRTEYHFKDSSELETALTDYYEQHPQEAEARLPSSEYEQAGKTSCTFDKSGRLMSQSIYNEEEKQTSVRRFAYNKNGQLTGYTDVQNPGGGSKEKTTSRDFEKDFENAKKAEEDSRLAYDKAKKDLSKAADDKKSEMEAKVQELEAKLKEKTASTEKAANILEAQQGKGQIKSVNNYRQEQQKRKDQEKAAQIKSTTQEFNNAQRKEQEAQKKVDELQKELDEVKKAEETLHNTEGKPSIFTKAGREYHSAKKLLDKKDKSAIEKQLDKAEKELNAQKAATADKANAVEAIAGKGNSKDVNEYNRKNDLKNAQADLQTAQETEKTAQAELDKAQKENDENKIQEAQKKLDQAKSDVSQKSESVQALESQAPKGFFGKIVDRFKGNKETEEDKNNKQEAQEQGANEQEAKGNDGNEQEAKGNNGNEQEADGCFGIASQTNTAEPHGLTSETMKEPWGQESENESELLQQLKRVAFKNKYMELEGKAADPDYKSPFTQIASFSYVDNGFDGQDPYVKMKLGENSEIYNRPKQVYLETKGKYTAEDCAAMVRLGMEKGWKSATLDGPEEFKALMYIEMVAMGMEVRGDYQPSPEVQKAAEAKRKEYEEKGIVKHIQNVDKNYSTLKDVIAPQQLKNPEDMKVETVEAMKQRNASCLPAKTQDNKAKEPEEKSQDNKLKEPEEKSQDNKLKEPEEKSQEQTGTKASRVSVGMKGLAQEVVQETGYKGKGSGKDLYSKSDGKADEKMKGLLENKSIGYLMDNFKNLPQAKQEELSKKLEKEILNMSTKHPDVANKMLADLSNDKSNGPSKVAKAFGNAYQSIRAIENGKQQPGREQSNKKEAEKTTSAIMAKLKENAAGR